MIRSVHSIVVAGLVSVGLLVGCRSWTDSTYSPEPPRFDPYAPEWQQSQAPGRMESVRYDSSQPRPIRSGTDQRSGEAQDATLYLGRETNESRKTYDGDEKVRESRETPYEGPFDDQHFVEKASIGGLFEVESSRLALEQRTSDETRKFARMMIEDHGKTNQELSSLARQKNLRASATLDDKHQEKLDELRRLEGAEFDRKYRQCQIKAHDEAIALFERAERECKDSELKAFAARTLPTLRTHRGHLDSPEVEVSER